MCGINLIIDKTSNLDDQVIQRMNDAIRHRGPDHADWVIKRSEDRSYHIGNTRLQIVDLHQRANQPMLSEDGKFALTFNGEIYNHPELRTKLEKLGYSFRTSSDTEVLLKWLIHFGKEGIAELNGMFAFALIDFDKGTALLARDRHGMKPLYYAKTHSVMVFSSEIKGILVSNLISVDINSEQIPHYLQFKYANANETFYKGIQAVTPGYCLSIKGDRIAEEPFHIESVAEPGEISVDHIEKLLEASVSRHLIADTPVGIFLSGGVDSTLLLALTKKLGRTSIPTFSVAHAKSAGSFGTADGNYASKAAQLFGSDHHEFEIDHTMLEDFNDHLQHMDQPVGDSSTFLTSYLSAQAANHVKCVLSGAGADEWFAGYNRHQAYFRYLNNSAISGNARVLRGFSKLLPTGVDHPLRKKFQLAKKFLQKVDPNPLKTYYNFLQFQYFEQPSDFDAIELDDYFSWALNHDRRNYLVKDILMLSDKWSMSRSLEMRMPYLDNELTQYLHALPQTELISKGKKWILKSILDGYGGQEFSQRPKEGFGLPTGKWLHGGHFSEHLDFLNAPQSVIFNYIDQKHIQNLVGAHMSKKQDYSLEIWSVMVLANWLEIHFA